MATDLKSKVKDLQTAKRDFVKAAKAATVTLGKERDRLTAKLKQANARVRQSQTQLKARAEKLAATSKSSAEKTRLQLQSQVAKLKAAATAAKQEARKTADELVLVRKDLADARRHLSHALHVDRAIARLEKALAKRKTTVKKAA